MTTLCPDELAFRQAILADPFDDTVRLVYADWLQENGQEQRADLVRWACCNPKDSMVCLCGIRENPDDIPCPVCKTFPETDSIPRQLGTETRYVINRGFVSELRLPLAAFLEQAGELCGKHPLTRIVASDKVPHHFAAYSDNGHKTPWGWLTTDSPDNQANPERHASMIPDRVFERVKQYGKWIAMNRPGNGWATQQAASDALSRALIDLGREEAGLPELVFPELSTGKTAAGAVG